MKNANILLFARQFCSNVFKQRSFYLLWLVFATLLGYAALTGYRHMEAHNQLQQQFQQSIRKSWENNPDKHPHRMAHFGSFALRLKHPLSIFDFGMEPYAGNAVYLEAHRQNTLNHSEASFSTGMLRMGDLSMAMLLQMVLPLILFFLGYSSIAADRENGTLKIIATQGGTARQLLLGRALGLWGISNLFFVPAFLATALLMAGYKSPAGTWAQFGVLLALHIVFFWLVSATTLLTSAFSTTAKQALIKLLGIWLLMAVVLPKLAPVVAANVYPLPAKLQFEAAVEQDILKQGDSHNPDDPFFKKLKDSVLQRYGVKTADSLPVNLGGIVGKAGEALSTEVYLQHQAKLTGLQVQQNTLAGAVGFANPFILIKQLSMGFSGTDFAAYDHFRGQAESYRYTLAQRMNDLQIEFISNTKPKEGNHKLTLDHEHWKELPDFGYQFLPSSTTMANQSVFLGALAIWAIGSIILMQFLARRITILS